MIGGSTIVSTVHFTCITAECCSCAQQRQLSVSNQCLSVLWQVTPIVFCGGLRNFFFFKHSNAAVMQGKCIVLTIVDPPMEAAFAEFDPAGKGVLESQDFHKVNNK